MTRLIAMAAAAGLLAACATAQTADAASSAPGDGANCDVTMIFGSYAMGIDGETFAKAEAYLKRRTDLVAKVDSTSWGREGERTLCIDARTDKATRKVFTDLRAMTPTTARRGPVTIKSRLGQGFQSKPPKRMG